MVFGFAALTTIRCWQPFPGTWGLFFRDMDLILDCLISMNRVFWTPYPEGF